MSLRGVNQPGEQGGDGQADRDAELCSPWLMEEPSSVGMTSGQSVHDTSL